MALMTAAVSAHPSVVSQMSPAPAVIIGVLESAVVPD